MPADESAQDPPKRKRTRRAGRRRRRRSAAKDRSVEAAATEEAKPRPKARPKAEAPVARTVEPSPAELPEPSGEDRRVAVVPVHLDSTGPDGVVVYRKRVAARATRYVLKELFE